MTPNPKPCDRCGEPHARCSAHTRAGKPCGQPPMRGQRVCKMHGGKSPRAAQAAERRLQDRAALQALETFGVPVTVDPHTALLDELHRTAGAVAWLGAVVADLDRDSVTWGVTKVASGGPEAGTTREAGVNTWVSLWQSERKHLVEVSKACVSAGIEERRIRLAESSGQLLASVIQAVLGRLELTQVQRELVAVVVPEELRRVAELETGGAA